MQTMTAFAAILAFVLMVACGPTAPSSQNGGESGKSQEPTTTTIPIPTQYDGPVPPTATPPLTEEPPPLFDPTKTPKPTPTRHPNDPAYEPDPTPTRGPTPDIPPGPALRSQPKPPNGTAACYTITPYASTIQELEYLSWCNDALIKDVIDNCTGADDGTSDAEHRCGIQRLANVQSYSQREVGVACFAISDEQDRIACGQKTYEAAGLHMKALWSTWTELLRTVDGNSEVKARKNAMADCVAEKGYARPDPDEPLVWQVNNVPDGRKPAHTETGESRAAKEARLTATDQCAHDVGLYAAQEAAWLSEIQRLLREDPAKVKPLLDEGIMAALDADGPALFLTARQ